MSKKPSLFILLLICIVSISSVNGQVIQQDKYLPNQDSLVVSHCVGVHADCTRRVCETVNVTNSYTVDIIEVALKREVNQVESPIVISFWNTTATHTGDKVLGQFMFSDGTEITLNGSLVYHNFSISPVNVVINREYMTCIGTNASTPEYRIHTAVNGSNGYSRGGFIKYSFGSAWDTGEYTSKDTYFGLFSNLSSPYSLGLKTNLINNSFNYTNPNILITYNGTYTGTDGIFDCRLLNSSNTLNTTLNVNISTTQSWNYTFIGTGNYYFEVNCTNEDISNVTGKYYYQKTNLNVPLTDNQLLYQINIKIGLINEVLDMIPLVLLYAVFMVLGYYMIHTGNWISGWSLYSISIGFDFLFAGWLRDKYISVILQNYAGSFSGSMTFIFLAFLFVWIGAKILSLLVFQIKVWKA